MNALDSELEAKILSWVSSHVDAEVEDLAQLGDGLLLADFIASITDEPVKVNRKVLNDTVAIDNLSICLEAWHDRVLDWDGPVLKPYTIHNAVGAGRKDTLAFFHAALRLFGEQPPILKHKRRPKPAPARPPAPPPALEAAPAAMMEASLSGDLQRVQVSVQATLPAAHLLATVMPAPPGRKPRALAVAPVLASLLSEWPMFGTVCLVAQAWCHAARSLRSTCVAVLAPADARESVKVASFAGKKLHGWLRVQLCGDSRLKQLQARNASKILKMLARKRLKGLRLTGHAIGDEGALALREALPCWSQLETLDLNYNEIGPHGGQAAAGFVASTLQVLDLSFNPVGDQAVAQLAAALEHTGTTALRRLNLSRVGATEEALGALCAAVGASCPGLDELDLSSNRIEDAGFEALAALMLQLPRLRTLSLDDNDTGTRGAVAVASAICKCSALELVELRGLEEEPADAAEDVIVETVPEGACPEVVVEL